MVLTGCPPDCEQIEYDFGTLPAEALELVPYEDGATYSLRHSAGHEILFYCQRERSIENEYWDHCVSVIYEEDITTLSPDYPIFDMAILMRKNDSIHSSVIAHIGQSNFALPHMNDYGVEYAHFDSLKLDGNWYRDVYAIKSNTSYFSNDSGIFPDSLWYNTTKGILKVGMSNDEFYRLIPQDE